MSHQQKQKAESTTMTHRSRLPIQAKRLDHYTLICEDAKEVADFHVKALGFDLDSIKHVNSGTVKEGEVDMLNYILRPPANKDMVMVVTEGLNDDTMFRKYMKSFGPGVHHLAFEVDDVDSSFAAIKEAGIQTTSNDVTTDMISGLKQIFIVPSHAGFFVELIERPTRREKRRNLGYFAKSSMAELAQSIRDFVEDDSLIDADRQDSRTDEKKEDFDLVKEHIDSCAVGGIAAIEISVKNVTKAADFLVNVLNFRMMHRTGEKIRLILPGRTNGNKGMGILLSQACSRAQERQATVIFNTPNLTESKIEYHSQAGGIEKYSKDGIKGILLSEKFFSYKALLANPSHLAEHLQVVRSHPHENELDVHIKAGQNVTVGFLANPANLGRWTGHKAQYSRQRNSWVETRQGSDGRLRDFILHVSAEGDSQVTFLWPEREVKVTFRCVESAPGYSVVSVTLPNSAGERRLGKMKHIIMIELEILKAILEENTEYIPDRHFQHIQAYSTYGSEARNMLPEKALEEFSSFKGEIVRHGSMFDLMSTDFALTIKSQPQAVLSPKSTSDISTAIKMAVDLNIPLAARGSQVSHSAGGQAQAPNGLLLNMSTLSSVDFVDGGKAVKVGPGTLWCDVIRETLSRGLIPPVVNDYQYLSVGGTMSMGGVGFMSHENGIQAGHVKEMEVVTGLGHVVTCSNEENRGLFDTVRGGLGQCGIICSVTIPLVPAPRQIYTFKLFYKSMDENDIQTFVEDVQVYVQSGLIEMIHAFLKPSKPGLLGDEVFSTSSTEFQSTIMSGEAAGDLVFFLELGCYMWGTLDDTTRLGDVKDFLSSSARCIGGDIFDEVQDFHDYITKDPPVVETNKAHGKVPHPSFATTIEERRVVELLNRHIHSPDRGNDDVNEILIMPVRSNSALNKGHDVPLFPLPSGSDLSFFLLFLGSVVPESENDSSETIMDSIRAHHRGLYQLSNRIGGKRYSYDTITSEVSGESAWRDHYGDAAWELLCKSKRQNDPYHIFCPGIKMWD